MIPLVIVPSRSMNRIRAGPSMGATRCGSSSGAGAKTPGVCSIRSRTTDSGERGGRCATSGPGVGRRPRFLGPRRDSGMAKVLHALVDPERLVEERFGGGERQLGGRVGSRALRIGMGL